jgi:hypothetical protein
MLRRGAGKRALWTLRPVGGGWRMVEPSHELMLSLLRDIRKEQTDQRTLLLGVAEAVRRLEARHDKRILTLENRIADLRDDLELMLKSELMGARTHFEVTYEHKLEAPAGRLATIENQPS